jgi:hypothetical protein
MAGKVKSWISTTGRAALNSKPKLLALTLCTSGVPSPVILAKQLLPPNKAGRQGTYEACPLILHTLVSIRGHLSIFRGLLSGRKVIAKVAEKDEEEALTGETRIYHQLGKLQGFYIPVCYGLYRTSQEASILVLQDCGNQVESFGGLEDSQRYAGL